MSDTTIFQMEFGKMAGEDDEDVIVSLPGTEGEAKIVKARTFEFDGANKDEVVDSVIKMLAKSSASLNRKQIGEAYDIAEERGRYGSPASAWGLANGITELSQTSEYTDERVKMDRVAGKILEVAF